MSTELFMHLIPSAPAILGPIHSYSLQFTYSLTTYLLSSGILPLTCIWSVTAWILVMARRLETYKKKQRELIRKLQEQQIMMANQELEIQEAERKRIAADIHDEIGGNLAAIRVNLQSLHYSAQDEQRASCLLQLVDQTSQNVRRAAHNLIPPLFGNIPLTDILQSYFSVLNTPATILFHFCTNKYQPYFDPRQELILYRIIMELTNNIIRHAKASAATIQLLYYPEYLEILVEDDGIGLPISSNRHVGIGLTGVRNRVRSLGGNIHIDSGISGTTFIIHIPVIAQHAASC